MTIFSWSDKWVVPHGKINKQLAGISMSIFTIISLVDAAQRLDPHGEFDQILKSERSKAISQGKGTVYGTTKSMESLEDMLVSKKYTKLTTLNSIYSIRIPTEIEICIQLVSMLYPKWSVYSTSNTLKSPTTVPNYILSDGKGDFISPLEVYNHEMDTFDVPYADSTHLFNTQVMDGSCIKAIFSPLGAYTNLDTKEKLINKFPSLDNIIEQALQPGARFPSIILDAQKLGYSDLAAIGDELGIISTIGMIKCINGIQHILSEH